MRLALPARLAAACVAVLLGAACPTVDLGDPPVSPGVCMPDPAKFQSVIWPMAIAPADNTKSCVAAAGCHAQATGRSALRLLPTPMTAQDYAQNYDVVTRFLNCGTPAASSFVSKPASDGDPHAGGDLWPASDSGQEPTLTVEKWIGGTL